MAFNILNCFLKWKKVEDLIEDAFYEFKVAAANLVGIGQPSDPSEHFKCKAWTMPEPGKSINSSWISKSLKHTHRALQDVFCLISSIVPIEIALASEIC